MSGRIIAIGDIHGCSKALRALLSEIAPQADDTVVPLGDYVDRGPDSFEVLEQLIALRQRCDLKPIMGNHEEMMLNVIDGQVAPYYWLTYGATDTLDAYGFMGDLSVIPNEHIDFLKSCRDYFETDNHFFVHANYSSDLPLEQQSIRTMRWLSLAEQMPPPHISGKIAVVGHTPDKSGEILSLHHLKCIDTYCHGGAWLTALDVVNGEVWQANFDGHLRNEPS